LYNISLLSKRGRLLPSCDVEFLNFLKPSGNLTYNHI
jgi:hypothetical protein